MYFRGFAVIVTAAALLPYCLPACWLQPLCYKSACPRQACRSEMPAASMPDRNNVEIDILKPKICHVAGVAPWLYGCKTKCENLFVRRGLYSIFNPQRNSTVECRDTQNKLFVMEHFFVCKAWRVKHPHLSNSSGGYCTTLWDCLCAPIARVGLVRPSNESSSTVT